MTFVTAISKAHSQDVAICLKEWGGYWYFANDGYLRNADNTLVENYRIAMYATREDWQIVHVKKQKIK